jgi:RNA polymerase sigma-70 factor (ECF subfamily)
MRPTSELPIGGAQAGDRAALEVVYRALHPQVFAYLRSLLALEDAEDAASDVFVAVARGLSDFQGSQEAFRSWVFTIAHRRLVDHHRAGARRPRTRSLTPAEGDGHDGLAELPGPHDPAAEVTAALAGDEAVRRIVALLPPDQAEVVLLRVVAGLPVDEVAAATGRRPGTVRVLQHRALRRLADRLERRPEQM